jgi:hypothetical protein
LIVLGPSPIPAISLKSTTTTVTDAGITSDSVLEFVNPTTVTLTNLNSTEFSIGFKNVKVLTITSSGILITQGLNQFHPNIAVNFNQAPEAVAALSDTVNSIMNGGQLDVELIGPISMPQVPIIAQLTSNMVIKVPGT